MGKIRLHPGAQGGGGGGWEIDTCDRTHVWSQVTAVFVLTGDLKPSSFFLLGSDT